VGEDW
jgi:hypothetical protein